MSLKEKLCKFYNIVDKTRHCIDILQKWMSVHLTTRMNAAFTPLVSTYLVATGVSVTMATPDDSVKQAGTFVNPKTVIS